VTTGVLIAFVADVDAVVVAIVVIIVVGGGGADG
jgi:hypothetical protein